MAGHATRFNSAWQRQEWEALAKELDVRVRDAEGDDWLPTPHGLTLARAIARSPKFPSLTDKTVLELGGGVGNHTVLLKRKGPSKLVVTEYTRERLDATRQALAENDMLGDDVELRVADWLHTDGTFDMVVTNPPFCRSGQRNRRYFIDELILNSHRRLRPQGYLVFIQSSMADLQLTLDSLARNKYDAEVIEEARYPWRKYYFDDSSFLEECDAFDGAYEVGEDGQRFERLFVIVARLRPWDPPRFAH